MAFVYEAVSQEDIKKYNIVQLYAHYFKLAKLGGLDDGLSNQEWWFVDRERKQKTREHRTY